MPVKNKSRLTNSSFKGVITSLNKEEKEVLAKEGIASSDKVPTDIAVKDNKLGLEHDNVWLANQNAINLGDNMTYDATTKTLNVKGGGSSEIPTLSTVVPSMSDLATTVYSDDDIALIKKQKDNFIKVPFGTAENNTSELCYVFSLNNAYSLIDIAGSMLSVVSAFSESPTFIYFNLDETNKKLVGESYSALSATDTSLYVLSSDNQIYLTNQLKSGVGQALNKSYYFDKINGKSIIHEENTINNYDLGKSINLFGKHSILVPNSSTDTEINLYNHFITLSGSDATCNFTITNSRPDPYTSVEDIYNYLKTPNSSISISATGSYEGPSGKGIVSKLQISSQQGYSIVSFTKLEIEVVENVPTIKTTEMASNAYFSSVYSDKVIKI